MLLQYNNLIFNKSLRIVKKCNKREVKRIISYQNCIQNYSKHKKYISRTIKRLEIIISTPKTLIYDKSYAFRSEGKDSLCNKTIQL